MLGLTDIASSYGERIVMRNIVLKDWQDFLRQAEELQRVSETRGSTRSYIFRGVLKASYGLKPSLLRLLEGEVPDPGVALKIAHEALKEFIRRAHLHLQTGRFLGSPRRRPWSARCETPIGVNAKDSLTDPLDRPVEEPSLGCFEQDAVLILPDEQV